jgi:hypothetical protein
MPRAKRTTVTHSVSKSCDGDGDPFELGMPSEETTVDLIRYRVIAELHVDQKIAELTAILAMAVGTGPAATATPKTSKWAWNYATFADAQAAQRRLADLAAANSNIRVKNLTIQEVA